MSNMQTGKNKKKGHDCYEEAIKETWVDDYFNPHDYHGHGQDEYEGDVCQVCGNILNSKLINRY